MGDDRLRAETLGPRVLYTAEEAATLLAISERTLRDLTKAGQVACVRIGSLPRYRRAALEAFAETREAYEGLEADPTSLPRLLPTAPQQAGVGRGRPRNSARHARTSRANRL
jgi:excisionase family DNA binding protein